MKTPLYFLLLLVATAFPCAGGAAADSDAQIDRIQKAYEGITDLRGTFTQTNIIRDLDKKDAYRGEFFIKRPLKMKWKYTGKSAQDITINNDQVLIYRKGDTTAFRASFDRATYGQTPVALLGGFGDIRKEFTVTGSENRLILKPKTPLGTVVSITVVLDDGAFPIRSFIIQDGRNNTIEIELGDVRINTGIKDSLFNLSVPDGVSIFEQPS